MISFETINNGRLFLQLVLVATGDAAHVLEGGHDVFGVQSGSGDFRVGVFRFTVAPKDDDSSRLEAFPGKIALDVFGFHAFGHLRHFTINLIGIQDGPPAQVVRDFAVSKGPVEIEVVVAVQGIRKIVLLEVSQSLVVHSSLLNDPEYSKVREDRRFACHELGQLLTVFAAQNSSGSADNEAEASRETRVLGNGLGSL